MADTCCATSCYLQDLSTHPHTLPFHQKDLGEKCPCPWQSPQTQTVTTDTFQITPANIIEAYMEEQQQVVVWWPDKPFICLSTVFQIQVSGKQQASLNDRLTDGSLCAPQQEISLPLSLATFFSVLLHGSDLASLGVSLDGTSRPTSPTSALNLFRNRSWGGARVFLLVPEVMNFRLPDLPFQEYPIPPQETQVLPFNSWKLGFGLLEVQGLREELESPTFWAQPTDF